MDVNTANHQKGIIDFYKMINKVPMVHSCVILFARYSKNQRRLTATDISTHTPGINEYLIYLIFHTDLFVCENLSISGLPGRVDQSEAGLKVIRKRQETLASRVDMIDSKSTLYRLHYSNGG